MAGNPFDDLIPRPGSVQNAPAEAAPALDVTPGTTIVPGTAERYPDIPSSLGSSARQPMPGTLVFGDDFKPAAPVAPVLPSPGGWTDPQQYAELAKGVIPGAIKSAGTVLQAPDVIAAKGQQGAASFGARQLDVMDRIDRGERVTGIDDALGYQDMTPEQRATERSKLQQAQQAFNPTPIQDRTFFNAGEGVQNYAKTVLPAAPGYENSFGRQVGEGGGSLMFGIPIAAIFGPVAGGVTFSAMGVGEAAQRAVDYDRKERAAGRPGLSQDQIATAGLLGVGPGATDVLPVEVLLGRLPVRIPEFMRKPLAQAISRIGTQAVIEGVQEGGQGFLQDLIAREVYNPNQVLGENFRNEAEVGAAVGGLAEIFRQMGAGVIRSAAGRRGPSAGQPQPTPEAPQQPPRRQEPELPWPVAQNVETPPAPPQTAPPEPSAPVAPPAPQPEASANPFSDLVPPTGSQITDQPWVGDLAASIAQDPTPQPTEPDTQPDNPAPIPVNPDGTVTLYRGDTPSRGRNETRPTRSGQNWTSSPDNAAAYAGETGKVYAITVPADRVPDLQSSTIRPDEFRVPEDLRAKDRWRELTDQMDRIEANTQPDILPDIPDAPVPSQAPQAAPSKVITPDGSMEIDARPEIVELADLKRAEGALQPRDRSRAEYAQESRERAANLDPERLRPSRTSDTGAPIVAADGTVLSGNGRTMSIEQVYRDPELARVANTYRQSLGSAAAGMREPVLVMRASSLSPQDAARFADLSNRTNIAQMSATERAMRDAQAMGLDGIALYEGGDFGAPQNQRFMRHFMTRAVTAAEMPSISRNNELTMEGVARMRAAVLAAAYGDADVLSRMLESTDDNVRSITAGMLDAAPQMAQLRAGIASGDVDPGMDPVQSLMEAVKTISLLRSQKVPVQQWLAQSDAFGRDPVLDAWVKSFYYGGNNATEAKRHQEKVATLLNDYAAEAVQHRPGGLFADETTTADVLGVAMRKNDAGQDVAEASGPMGEAVPKGRAGKGRRQDGASGQATGEDQPTRQASGEILAALQSGPSRLEYEARTLLKDARDYEDYLIGEGSTPQQIADAFNRRYGSAVTSGQIENGNVWWRQLAGERESSFATTDKSEAGILPPSDFTALAEYLVSETPLTDGVAAAMDVDARPSAPQQTRGVSGGSSPGPRLTTDQRQAAVAMAQQGLNSRQIAAELKARDGTYVRSDLVDAVIDEAKATSSKAAVNARSAARRRAYYDSPEFREASAARMRAMMARPEMKAWAASRLRAMYARPDVKEWTDDRGRKSAEAKGLTVWSPAMVERMGQPDMRAMTAQQATDALKAEFGESASKLTMNAVRQKRSNLGYADTVAGKSPFSPEMEERLASPEYRAMDAEKAASSLKREFGEAANRITATSIRNKRLGNPALHATSNKRSSDFPWAPDVDQRLAALMTEAANPTERAAILNKEFGGPGVPSLSPKAVSKRWDKIRNAVLRSQGEEPMFAAGGWDAASWLDWIKGKPDVGREDATAERGTGDARSQEASGQQPGTGKAGSGSDAKPASGGADGVRQSFKVRDLLGRVVDAPPNAFGLRQQYVFLHPPKITWPFTNSAKTTLKNLEHGVPNWTAKAHVSEGEPGVWQVMNFKVRKNQAENGLTPEFLDALQSELGDIRPPDQMTPESYNAWRAWERQGSRWSNTSIDGYVEHKGTFYAPDMLRTMQAAMARLATSAPSAAERNTARREFNELSDLVDKLPPEDDILAAIQGSPSLDLSPEARKQRAEDMGFDTSEIAYRGLTRPYDGAKTNYYQMFTSNPWEASEYAMANPMGRPNVIASYIRKGRNLEIDAMGRPFNRVQVQHGKLPADMRGKLDTVSSIDEIAHAARLVGYDTVTVRNVIDNATGEVIAAQKPASSKVNSAELDAILAELGPVDLDAAPPQIDQGYTGVPPDKRGPVTVNVVFDPAKNARGVNATFDPSQEASADLMAAVNASQIYKLDYLAMNALSNGRPYVVPKTVVQSVIDAATPHLGMVLPDAFGVLGKLKPLTKPNFDGKVDTVAEFVGPDGNVLFDARVNAATLMSTRAVTFPDISTMGIIPLVLPKNFSLGIRGKIGHENVHVLRSDGYFAAPDWSALVAHGKFLKVMGMTSADYRKATHDDVYKTSFDDATRLELYEALYSKRTDKAARLDEEGVAHMLELYANGYYTNEQVAPVKPLLDAILDGSIWRIPQEGEVQQGELELMGAAQGSGGLDLSPEARKARAEADGFDTSMVWYHGTKQPVEAFNLRKAGVSDPGLVGKAVYVTPSGEQAGQFATSQHYGRGDQPNVMPLYLRMRNPAIVVDGVLPDGRSLTDAHPRGIQKDSATALNRELKTAGHDGVIFQTADGEVTQAAVFDPKNVRSVNADFDPERSGSSDLLAAAQKGKTRLAALHNLSAENLAFADKMGGIAAPSVAVVKEGMGVGEGFGEITLIGRKDLGDPGKNPVYDADAWSIRFPRPDYKAVTSSKAQKLMDSLRPYGIKFADTGNAQETWDAMVNRPDPERAIRPMLRSEAAQAMFLDQVKGKTIEPVMRSATESMRNPWVMQPAFQAFLKQYGYDGNYRHGDPYYVAMSKAAKEATNQEIAAKVAEIEDPEDRADRLQFLTENADEHLFDENGLLHYGRANWVGTDIRKIGQKEIDPTKTRDRLQRALKPFEAEFKTWAENQIVPLYGEPRIKVNGRLEPYTLENITRVMTAPRSVQAQEDHMTFGEGKARAAAARKIDSLEEARNRSEWQMGTEAEIEEAREHAKKLMDEWRTAVVPYNKYVRANSGQRGAFGSTFEALDGSMRAMATAAKRGGISRDALRSALSREDFVGVPADVLELGVEAGKAFMSAPVPYFESKPQRSVKLNEFAGAVIPKKASAETKAILEKHGIPYQTYDSNKEGAKDKAAAKFTRELAKQGQDTLFAFAGMNAKTADLQSLDRADKMEDEGKSPLDIWNETGWFRGPDNEWKFEIDDSRSLTRGFANETYHNHYNWNGRSGKEVEARRASQQAADDIRRKVANGALTPEQGQAEWTAARAQYQPIIDEAKMLRDAADQLKVSGTLPETFRHDALYDAYPQFKDVEANLRAEGLDSRGVFHPQGGRKGAGQINVDNNLDSRERRSTTLHEIQHAIQEIEDFGRGGNPDVMAGDIAQAKNTEAELSQKMTTFQNRAYDEVNFIMAKVRQGDADAKAFADAAWAKWSEKLGEQSEDNPYGIDRQGAVHAELLDQDEIYNRLASQYDKAFRVARDDPYKRYRSLAGEEESRAVQKRQDLTADERRARPPWQDYDTPPERQIVTRSGGRSDAFGSLTTPGADIQAYTNAVAMAKRGASPKEIWDATGWVKDTKGKWRFETDEPAEIKTVAESKLHHARQAMTPDARRAAMPSVPARASGGRVQSTAIERAMGLIRKIGRS